MPSRLRVAVLGAGLAGLAAAWLIGRRHEVTLFERQPRPGFTAASVSVPGPGAASCRVDVPLRVFYPGYYPTLLRLYRALGAAVQPVSYASTFEDARGERYFRYRNLRLGGRSWSWVAPADLLQPAARRIVADALRFHRDTRAARDAGALGERSVGDLVRAHDYAGDFVDGLLLPAICTVCTCSPAQALRMPAAVVADYLLRGLAGDAVHRARHGADDVQQRLLGGIATLRCGVAVAAVRADEGGAALRFDDGRVERFDHAVLAAPPHHAGRLVQDGAPQEAALLLRFRLEPVQVLTHRDASFMPRRRSDWSPVNLRLADGDAAPQSTIWLNAVQPDLRGGAPLFQTVHPQAEPAEGTLLGRARFERPVVDADSQRALQALLQLQAQPGRRLWFCGSYANAGVPLLESAARSAAEVAARLGAGF
ncbi:MAG: NAD(P)-binding protein [Rubrivivax sp.]